MNHPDQVDNAAIVREVVRRLAVIAEQQVGTPANTELRLTDRVVTLEVLKSRLGDARTIVVPPGTVITPSARDELRARGVEIARTTLVDNSVARPVLLALDVEGQLCLREWQQRIGFGTEFVVERCREVITARMADWVATGGIGLWWTTRTASAACAANRDHRIRAVVAHDDATVQEAIAEAASNVLIIDPRRKQPIQWKNWIERMRCHVEQPAPQR